MSITNRAAAAPLARSAALSDAYPTSVVLERLAWPLLIFLRSNLFLFLFLLLWHFVMTTGCSRWLTPLAPPSHVLWGRAWRQVGACIIASG